jgi:hypothetical protein
MHPRRLLPQNSDATIRKIFVKIDHSVRSLCCVTGVKAQAFAGRLGCFAGGPGARAERGVNPYRGLGVAVVKMVRTSSPAPQATVAARAVGRLHWL